MPSVSSTLSTVTKMASETAAAEDFRSVVLRGVNVASYKFALAKSILALAESGATSTSLEDLAVPFSHELCEHLKARRQATPNAAPAAPRDSSALRKRMLLNRDHLPTCVSACAAW